jgi:UDP-N-acetylmuramoyl-L-alanyl-D-glutamate--2,6-diaminopimelate ligase
VIGLATDSRRVRPGDVFFALRGGNRHGLEFLEAVQAAGAIAVVWEPPYTGDLPPAGSGAPLLVLPDLRRNLGLIASRFYDQPSCRMAVVGITGTDGKTSCAHFIAQALSDAETGPCGLLGTLGLGVYGAAEPTLHTTPEVLTVQRWLAKLAAGGRRYAVMEASSHALDQGRVEGVEFMVAVLTHLSRDHLDYHGTLEAYAAAKRRLFLNHRPRWAVLNLDDAFGQGHRR